MVPMYTPPEGTYDQPYFWIFDSEAAGLVDGQDYPNLSVYIQGGYGDFVLRRVVGLDRVLNPPSAPPPGRYRLREANGDYMESLPVFSGLTVTPGVEGIDLAIMPERFYRETTSIRFALFNVKCACGI
jgi:hypothetical protein